MALVQEFAQSNSEQAFATLVSRHINLVYSVALRQVRDPHLAEEITQGVFIILAKKAKSLGSNTILSGWLCRTARYVSGHALRSQRRRQFREQEAHMQSIMNESDVDAWNQIAPILDEALGCLNKKEHDAVVLRFFEARELKQVGAAMGTTEDAARMRVNRGLDSLRKFFAKKGVALPAVAIAGVLSVHTVQAAPVGFAATVTATTIKGTALSATLTTLVKSTMNTMAWLKLKFAVGLSLVALLGTGGVMIALSAESTKPTAQPEQQDTLLIVPWVSVGKVTKYMTTNEVESVLGKPEKWQGAMMVYDRSLGMSVAQTKRGAMVVFCGDSSLKYPGVKAFKGRTKEGIGMLSTRAEVIKALGQPPTSQASYAGDVIQEQLEYKTLGLTFTLESGKVIHILVDFRAGSKPANPAGPN